MVKLLDYIFRLGKWLLESYQVMVVIGPSILIFVFSKEIGVDGIQFCGGVFQVIGTLYGIKLFVKVRDSFSFPSLTELFKDWVKRFPRWGKDVRVLAGNTIASMGQVSGKVSVWSPDHSSLSLEERIARIVKNQEELRQSLEGAEDTISKQRNEVLGRIENLESNFNSEIRQVKETLESIHMEDFLWALVGLLFILVGTVFSNFAKYIV